MESIPGLRVLDPADDGALRRSVVCMALGLHRAGALQHAATWRDGQSGVRLTPMMWMLLSSDYCIYDYDIGFEIAWPNCAT